MDDQATTLDPELVQLIATHSCRPRELLHPSTHIVVDLGIDGDDIDDLVDDIEKRFGFVGTDAEWKSVSCLGDLDALVSRLRGQRRPEAAAERERNASAVRHQRRRAIAAIGAWLGLGIASYILHRPMFTLWGAVSICVALARAGQVTYGGVSEGVTSGPPCRCRMVVG